MGGMLGRGHPPRVFAASLAVALTAFTGTAAARPLGDDRVSSTQPASGSLFACKAPTAGKSLGRPWIKGNRWFPKSKPVVTGSVQWPEAAFARSQAKGGTSFQGNGYPVGTPTGSFPAAPRSTAAGYAETGRAIERHAIGGRVPAVPRTGRRRCVSPGAPIGISVNGVPILPPSDVAGRDLVAREVTDACGGGVTGGGLYAYRTGSGCLPQGSKGEVPPIGFARDGYGIYGRVELDGRRVRERNLDVCHGHVGRVELADGSAARRYHYHATSRFPYVIGCFRGKPAKWAISRSPDPRATSITIPGLIPAWEEGISDYVIRCGGDPVRVDATTAPGASISIDGGPAASGRLARSVQLDAGQAFTMRTATAGEERAYYVRCLPDDFPDWTFERHSRPSQALYIVTPWLFTEADLNHYVIAFDRNGVPAWWYEADRAPLDAKLLPDGTMTWALWPFGAGPPETGYEVRRLDGSLVRRVNTVGAPTDHHDLLQLDGGGYMLVSYKPREHVDLSAHGGSSDATVWDSEIQEVDVDGNLVWSWNSKDHIDPAETGRWWPSVIATAPSNGAYDLTHINSIEVAGDSVIASFRHTDGVYSIDRQTGEIEWKLGGTDTPESLEVLDDPLADEPLGGQHDARLLPDGTLTIHDNGTQLNRPPRAIRYRLDLTLGTANLIESIGDPEAPSSFCCGSARRTQDGSWLMAWGGDPDAQPPLATEFAPNGSRAFSLRFGNSFSYRMAPVPDGVVDPAALRAGMDAIYPR